MIYVKCIEQSKVKLREDVYFQIPPPQVSQFLADLAERLRNEWIPK